MSSDKNILQQAKDKAGDVCNLVKEGAKNAKEAVFGEPSTEQKAADKTKELADNAADKASEVRKNIGQQIF